MSIESLFITIQNNISLIIILIFAGIPLLIGSAASTKSVATLSDFFLCNRSLGTAASFFTIYATWWSSTAFIGSTSYFYFNGPLYWIALGWNSLFGIIFLIFGKKIWSESSKNNYKTPIEFFDYHYNSTSLNNIVIILMFCLTIPYISVQFMGGGIIIEMATHGIISWKTGTLMFLIIMILYLWSGGLRAVVWTDTIYAIFIFFGMLLIGLLFIRHTGGIDATFKEITITYPDKLKLPETVNGINGYGFWMSLLITLPLGEFMMPQIWTRVYAVKEKKTFYVMPFLLSIATLAYLGTMLTGNAALILEPDYNNPSDYLLPTLLIEYLPPALMAVMVCSVVSACLSTANSQLHSLSHIATIDIYKAHINKKATEKHLIFVAKLLIIIIATIAYLLLLSGNLTTIFKTALTLFSLTMQLVVPFIGAAFWDKTDSDSAIAGLLLGIIITILFSFWQPFVLPVTAGTIGLIFNALLFTISCYFKSKSLEKRSGGSIYETEKS